MKRCLEYVPLRRQRDLVDHLMSNVVAPGGRLIVGNQNEEVDLRPTADLLSSWGYEVVGTSERPHPDPRLVYRVVWIEA